MAVKQHGNGCNMGPAATGLMEKRGGDANTFPFLTPCDLDISSNISIPTLFVFDMTDEWELVPKGPAERSCEG
jgi:hypothetical protein